MLLALLSLIPPDSDEMQNFGMLGQVYAAVYGGLILRTLVFFGCAWVFMNLFRGEVVDRSLHYYFLSPVRREVLVVGKYLSGLVATMVLFGITTAGSMLILFYGLFPSEAGTYFFNGAGARHRHPARGGIGLRGVAGLAQQDALAADRAQERTRARGQEAAAGQAAV